MNNIESLTVTKNVDLYKKFGWEKTQSVQEHVRRGRGHCTVTRYVLVRDKDMKNYSTIQQLENKYFKLYNQIKEYQPVNKDTAFLLYLLFIIPGIIYSVSKRNENEKIYNYNNQLKNKMKEIERQVASLM